MRQRHIAGEELFVDLNMPSSQSGRQKHARYSFQYLRGKTLHEKADLFRKFQDRAAGAYSSGKNRPSTFSPAGIAGMP
jgi:hypothetical protein